MAVFLFHLLAGVFLVEFLANNYQSVTIGDAEVSYSKQSKRCLITVGYDPNMQVVSEQLDIEDIDRLIGFLKEVKKWVSSDA